MASESAEEKKGYSPWDYIKSFGKKVGNHLDENPEDEKGYPAFIVNRALSMNKDTVATAALATSLWQLPPKLQHDFLFYIFPKGFIRTEWIKKDEEDKEYVSDLEMVKEYFLCNSKKAAVILSLINDEYKEEMRNMFNSTKKKKK